MRELIIGYARGIAMVFNVAIYTTSLSAQILGSPTEKVWNFAGSYQTTSAVNADYIGNYACLDLQSPQQMKFFKKIAKERSGTLFIVGKFESSAASVPVLELGGLAITSDSVFCAGHHLESDPLSEKPFILKVKYQAGLKRLWHKDYIHISPDLKLAEIVYYREQLTKEQSRIVESYLALKYSINITRNTEQVLRDYWANDSSRLWTAKADGIYDKEVMALGRLDFMQWEQVQTYTSDAQSIAISLDDPITLGNKPNKKLKDGSVVVMSKRLWDMQTMSCGSSNNVLPWKFKFFNWDSNADWLYLKWDTILNLSNAPRFTDGTTDIALSYFEQNGVTQVSIPLSHLNNLAHETWYLVWDNSHLSCLPLGSFLLNPCLSSPSKTNSINLQLDKDALPASYELKDVASGESISGSIREQNTFMDRLPKGQFHLRVYNSNGEWIDEILNLESCEEGANSSLKGVTIHQSASSIGLLASSNGTIQDGKSEQQALKDDLNSQIDLFPNPLEKGTSFQAVFNPGLYDKTFTIRILDKSGKLLLEESFVPSADRAFEKAISSAGVYLIQFKGEHLTEIKQLIVQ